MPPCLPALLLALLLLGVASPAQAQPSPCQTGVRRLELEGGSAPPPEICISPGLTTALLFDRELAEPVELEGRPRFERVDALGQAVLLLPSAKLSPGERLRLTVRFKAAEAPTSGTFLLVVHRDQAERQVEITRAPSRPAACQAELARKEAELQRCLGGLPTATGPDRQDSLARLLAAGAFGRGGLLARPLAFEAPSPAPSTALQVAGLHLHRTPRRLVVQVVLVNLEPVKPWRAGGALVTTASGQELAPLLVVQPAPLVPGSVGSVWVELEAPDEKLLERCTLRLWDEDTARTLTFPGLALH
jgi:uncharacterized protein (TIGR02268 family)